MAYCVSAFTRMYPFNNLLNILHFFFLDKKKKARQILKCTHKDEKCLGIDCIGNRKRFIFQQTKSFRLAVLSSLSFSVAVHKNSQLFCSWCFVWYTVKRWLSQLDSMFSQRLRVSLSRKDTGFQRQMLLITFSYNFLLCIVAALGKLRSLKFSRN